MFAGGGTVGIESFLLKRKSILLDINPLLGDIVKIKTFTEKLNKDKLYEDFRKVTEHSKHIFNPKWKNINHWYDKSILTILQNLWGNFYNKSFYYPLLIKFSLLYVSRAFSYSDDNIPKLYKSKNKVKKINKILKIGNIRKQIERKLLDRLEFIYNSINEFQSLVDLEIGDKYKPKVIIDDSYTLSKDFQNIISEKIDCIITSPPYLQAQEYIRSIKLDLYWSNYSDDYIKNLAKLEIPYRKPPKEYNINSKLIDILKKEIKFNLLSKKEQDIFNSYFFYTIQTIYNYSKFLKKGGILAIFVGSPSFKGFKVHIWEILLDFFLKKEFTLKEIFADPIVSRKLANKRNNNNPNGMDYEYLIILKKK